MKKAYLGTLVMIVVLLGNQVSFAQTPASVDPKEVSNSVNIDGVVNAEQTIKDDVNQSKPVLLAQASQSSTTSHSSGSLKKPNIIVIWGDDIGRSNLSTFTEGMMGYQTPNIDRLADEGMKFTDYYAEQSCTAGRSSPARPSFGRDSARSACPAPSKV